MTDERERNKRVIRDLLAAADAGDVESVLGFYADDYVDHDVSESRVGGVGDAFRKFLAAFPDTKHWIEDIVAEGDRVAVRVVAEGTHVGEIFGIPPSGRRVRTDSIVIYRLSDGKIFERWCRERRSTRELVEETSRPD